MYGKRLAEMVWEADSSSIVTARLKLMSARKRKVGGLRETINTFLLIVSIYTPTARASHTIKKKF